MQRQADRELLVGCLTFKSQLELIVEADMKRNLFKGVYSR